MKLVLPALARMLIEPRLPAGLDVTWFASPAEAVAAMPTADIAWVDLQNSVETGRVIALGERLKWVSTLRAGIDAYDLALLKQRGTILTNGAGINAVAVAEYAVMGVLVAAKRFDQVVLQAQTREWTTDAPGKVELFGSQALIVGYGTIGRLIGERLAGLGVTVTGVTRTGRDGTLAPDAWKPQLGAFDWVVLAAPAVDDTRALFGTAEFQAMKSSAWLINMARGEMVDQDALIEALEKRRIGGAFLDTVSPEPLPPDHPLWTAPNVIHTMHLSGRSQTTMFQRAAALFLENLDAFLAEREMRNVVDLDAGY